MKGTGTFTFSDGSTYVGEWESLGDAPKIKSGTGTFTSGPESYTGDWSMDQMNGKGKQTFATGATYEGDFVNNQYMGEGTYTWVDKCSYVGGWKVGGVGWGVRGAKRVVKMDVFPWRWRKGVVNAASSKSALHY